MSKYASLGDFLTSQKIQMVPMTFAEIERVIGTSLPRSARYPAWWSNNPSNNVMTQIWLDAGFRTEQVDISARKLVFRRTGRPAPVPQPSWPAEREVPGIGMAEAARPFVRAAGKHHSLLGALKGLLRITDKTDLTAPADPDWGSR